MGLIKKIFGHSGDAEQDATILYQKIMKQSRNPAFFGQGKVPDSYDGRVELLTLHMAAVMSALQQHGENGKRLSQALFDVMVDDFDVALREEGLTDSGVKRRIKPMIAFFYARLKKYSESFADQDVFKDSIRTGALKSASVEFLNEITLYAASFCEILSNLDLGVIAKSDFEFPEFA